MLTDVEDQIQTTEVYNRVMAFLETKKLAKTKKMSKRNKEIFLERCLYGTTYQELGETYGISATRCMHIIARISRMVSKTFKFQGVIV